MNTAILSLAALAHSARLSAVRLLVKAGPGGLSAGQLAELLGVLPNTLSSNLKALSHAGLVVSERDGRSIRYMVNYEQMQHLLRFLVEDCCCGVEDIKAPLMADLSEGCCP